MESVSTALNTKRCSMLISWGSKESQNLEHADVAWSRCRRSLPGTCKQKYLEVKGCSLELNLVANVCVSFASLARDSGCAASVVVSKLEI